MSIREAVNYCFLQNSPIKPLQVQEELLQFMDLISSRKPRAALEIGTCNGGTLFLLSLGSDEDAKIISVDMPGGRFGGGYALWRTRLYQNFARANQQIDLLRADSHTKDSFNQVRNALNVELLDLLFIDGDHTYFGVKKDFEIYSSLVRKGGLIAFHDILYDQNDPDCLVSKFWSEVKNKCSHFEIVQDINQGWAGIGVLENS
ncbi:MAG: class I SAM-dependent methyltransferase [archaeon]|nr:class I SAM-dependent methyltransferase [archaeon]